MRFIYRIFCGSLVILSSLGMLVACSSGDEGSLDSSAGVDSPDAVEDATPWDGDLGEPWFEDATIPPGWTPQQLPASSGVAPEAPSSSDHAFSTPHFEGSELCAACHDGLVDAAGKDISIVSAWSSTIMANATRDPFWQAKVRSEIERAPELRPLIEDKCSRCHAPMANVELDKVLLPIATLDAAGVLDSTHQWFDAALDGVSCTVCHQIAPRDDLGEMSAVSGQYRVDTADNPAERPIYGPFFEPMTGPMLSSVQYLPTQSDHVRRAALCASCHELRTPTVDAENVPTGSDFPEQMVFSEWLHSDWADQNEGKTCQQCHMPETNGVVISTRPPSLNTLRDAFGEHVFVGGNAFILRMLRDNASLLGVAPGGLEERIEATRLQLRGAASIAVEMLDVSEEALGFVVDIRNESGHKLPSGFPSRRVVVHVRVSDSSGAVVFESGAPIALGAVAGVDADADSSQVELHHDLIESGDQVQLYEAVMANTDGEVTYTLLRAATYIKDNRLLPKGFDKTTASAEIATIGAARDDNNFQGGGDRVTYRVPRLGTGPWVVQARLLYQTIAYPFAVDLFQSLDSTEISRLRTLWTTAGPWVEAMAETTATLQP